MRTGSASGRRKLTGPAPLSPAHDIGGFDCGEPALNDWLKQRALKNESRFSRTYVVCDENRVVAFFSLSAGAVQRSNAPRKIRRNAPDAIPVAVIGRLAVDSSYAGRGLGADILSNALGRVASASKSIGIGAVLVQAKDENAKRFYLACAEFIEFPAESRTLYLPVETVVSTFR
ncbi:MAG: GNAT family N-acetyltransferase [Allosphingosinicella sp.]